MIKILLSVYIEGARIDDDWGQMLEVLTGVCFVWLQVQIQYPHLLT